MTTLPLVAVGFMFAALAAAQTPGGPGKPGPVGMVFPVPGHPLSAEQIEERTTQPPGGPVSTEVVESKVYRDTAGRLRIEMTRPGPSGDSSQLVSLVDPIAGSLVVLVAEEKIAARLLVPKSSDHGFGFGFNDVEIPLPSGTGKRFTENLGTRTIDGIEMEGTRLTRTSADPASEPAVSEHWFAKDLAVTGMAEGSGPGARHTARLRILDRNEPDPALFVIPADYTVQDLSTDIPTQ